MFLFCEKKNVEGNLNYKFVFDNPKRPSKIGCFSLFVALILDGQVVTISCFGPFFLDLWIVAFLTPIILQLSRSYNFA